METGQGQVYIDSGGENQEDFYFGYVKVEEHVSAKMSFSGI